VTIEAAVAPDLDRPQWVKSIPFLAVHIVALAAPFLAPPTWRLAGLALTVYSVCMFGITAGFHRYFSHRAFRTGRAFQLVLAVLGTLSVQKGVLWWAAHHRDHHRYSDGEKDVHSPAQRGFWCSHVGWILAARYDRTRTDRVKDLARFPELVFLDRFGVVVPLSLAAVLFAAGGLPALLWGFFVPVVVAWHVTFSINSVAHVLGSRRYPTGDDSRNNPFLALLTFGEGWHNNHHFYATTASQGWFWWELDISYLALRALAVPGLVWDLRTPPAHVRAGRLPAPGREPGRRLQEDGAAGRQVGVEHAL
jgi:stearoyl-CoA desaturase (delta-9 desaturase)